LLSQLSRDDGKMCFDMKFSCFAFLGIPLLFVFTSQTIAQPSPDSVLYRESISSIHQVYINEIGDNAEIYHGSEFIRNGQKAVGFPFYQSDSLLQGSVSYQGTIYRDLDLFYNMVSDEVVTRNYAHNALITLSTEKIDSFQIGTHVFVQLSASKTNGLGKDGFYEQMYSGEPAFYVRREKRLVSGTGSEETRYIQYNYYYIRLKNIYYPVDGKKSLLGFLKDQENVLKKYIRANKLNFKKNLESSMVLSTIYYSQLNH
jgi:hypothetical protein